MDLLFLVVDWLNHMKTNSVDRAASDWRNSTQVPLNLRLWRIAVVDRSVGSVHNESSTFATARHRASWTGNLWEQDERRRQGIAQSVRYSAG